MARLLLGPLASAISGSVSGGTIQRTSSGTSARNRPLPRFRSSPRVTASRQFVAALALQWRTLTAAQRAAWSAQASTTYWRNVFGSTITARGYWLYMRLNLSLLQSGESAIDDPAGTVPVPVILDPSATASSTSSIYPPVVDASTSTKGTASTYTSDLPSGSGGLLLLYICARSQASAPTTETWTFLAASPTVPVTGATVTIYYRFADGSESAHPAGPVTLGSPYGWTTAIYRISQFDPAGPFGTSALQKAVGSFASPFAVPVPGLTTTAPNSLVLLSLCLQNSVGNAYTGSTLPSGFGNLEDPGTTFSIASSFGAKVYASPGSTGTLTSTATSTAAFNQWSAITLELLNVPGGSAVIDWSAPATIPSGYVLRVFASPGLSPGVAGPRDSLRLVDVLPPGTSAPYNLTPALAAAFGQLPTSGRLTFLELQLLHRLTGSVGPRQRISVLWS